jgi:hypothetical protein
LKNSRESEPHVLGHSWILPWVVFLLSSALAYNFTRILNWIPLTGEGWGYFLFCMEFGEYTGDIKRIILDESPGKLVLADTVVLFYRLQKRRGKKSGTTGYVQQGNHPY